MIFDEKLVKAVTKGVVSIPYRDGWFGFERLLPGQAEEFSRKGYASQVPCAAGVSLCFRTDARSLSFSYRVSGAVSRMFFYFDLLVNGKKVDSFGKEVGNDEGTCSFSLPAGEKEVELYLPCLQKVELKDIFTDGEVTPAPRLPKLLFLGDSITQGYDSHTPFGCYTSIVAHTLGYEQLNQGISGAGFFPGTLAEIPGFVPERIVVSFGTNDWKHGTRNFPDVARDYYKKLHEIFGDTPVFAIIPIWRKDCEPPTCVGTFEEAKDIIRDVCASYPNVTVVEGDAFFPRDTTLFADARLHPNEEGFTYYANGLLRAMQGKPLVPIARILGENRATPFVRTRYASRGIVLQDGKLLISRDVQMDMVMTPGGGREPGETDEQCCAREVAEETGVLVQVGEELLVVEEFYEDVRYVTRYYRCEPCGRTEKRLTALEQERGLVSEWVSPEQFLQTVSRHADFAAVFEEKRGLYLREYTAASRIL